MIGQTRRGSYHQDQQQAEPKRAIAVNLKLHAVVVSLWDYIEHEFRVKGEIKYEIE